MNRRYNFRKVMVGCILAGAVGMTCASEPPEAITACSGKAAGDTVSFTLRDGHQVSGKCQLENGVLAARPAGAPPG
jgi:hypothetical protein